MPLASLYNLSMFSHSCHFHHQAILGMEGFEYIRCQLLNFRAKYLNIFKIWKQFALLVQNFKKRNWQSWQKFMNMYFDPTALHSLARFVRVFVQSDLQIFYHRPALSFCTVASWTQILQTGVLVIISFSLESCRSTFIFTENMLRRFSAGSVTFT